MCTSQYQGHAQLSCLFITQVVCQLVNQMYDHKLIAIQYTF